MNIKDWLEETGIRFWKGGKNVSVGWINVQCPFCDDLSNHLGIRLKDFRTTCWRCGSHKFVNLIIKLVDCSFREAIKIEKSLSPEAGDYPPFSEGEDDASSSQDLALKSIALPRESTNKFPPIHTKYLRSRGFVPTIKFIRKYKLLSVYTIGRYKFRIIIPIFMNRKLVSFTSRDITERQEPKYLSASKKEATSIKETIYNYDSIIPRRDAILVEGPLDAWKFGDGAISLFGIKHTGQQILLLKEKKIRNLFIMFDNDKAGKTASKKFARIISPLVKKVEIVNLVDFKDPGELAIEEATMLKYQMGVK